MTTTKFYNFNGFNAETGNFESQNYAVVSDETGRYLEVGTGHGPDANKAVNLNEQYVMPGLINAHVHIDSDVTQAFGRQGFGVDDEVMHARAVATALANMKWLLKSGVTVVRNVGTANMTDIAVSRMQAEGAISGPYMIASGASFSITGGHGSGAGIEVDGIDEIRRSVRQAMKNGAKVIKFMATGGVSAGDFETPDQVQFNEDELRAGVLEAHKKQLKVAAHAQGAEGIKIAVRAGVDTIEHAFHLDDDAIAMMRERGTIVVPTMVAMKRILDRPDDVPAWMIERATTHWQAHQESVAKAAKAGVKIAMGTDSGTPFNGFFAESADEMVLMVEYGGMTPQQVLQAATINAAEALDVAADYGDMTVGKFADFITLTTNPATDIAAVRQEDKWVFQHGKAVYHVPNNVMTGQSVERVF